MKVKIQKPIEFVNQCNCLVDYDELEKAIVWYSDKPTARLKSIYLWGSNKEYLYPTVSIHDRKIFVHRLLMMYWLNEKDLDILKYVHHIDGNRLNSLRKNLQIMDAQKHPIHHLKGKKQEPEFAFRRTNASSIAKYGHPRQPGIIRKGRGKKENSQ